MSVLDRSEKSSPLMIRLTHVAEDTYREGVLGCCCRRLGLHHYLLQAAPRGPPRYSRACKRRSSGRKHGSLAAFVRMDAPVRARSVQGEMDTSAAGSGRPALRADTASTMVSPPPAESPATNTRAGSAPYSSRSQR